jgi:threonyl-tRNA synthetase
MQYRSIKDLNWYFPLGIFLTLIKEGFCSEVDKSNGTLNLKIRNAQNLQYNFICVVGNQE